MRKQRQVIVYVYNLSTWKRKGDKEFKASFCYTVSSSQPGLCETLEAGEGGQAWGTGKAA